MCEYTKPLPKVGDHIYVGSSFHLSRGRDDFQGGLCKVVNVEQGTSAGRTTHFVTVEERLTRGYNWEILSKEQDKLKKLHGDDKGYKDPDYSLESNMW